MRPLPYPNASTPCPVWLGLPVQEGMFAHGLLCLTTLDQMLGLLAFESPTSAEAEDLHRMPLGGPAGGCFQMETQAFKVTAS